MTVMLILAALAGLLIPVMRRPAAEGRTSLFATHYLEEAD